LQQAIAIHSVAAEIRWRLSSALPQSRVKAKAIAELHRLLVSRIPFAQETQACSFLQRLQAGC
jgi:hypothetical protein